MPLQALETKIAPICSNGTVRSLRQTKVFPIAEKLWLTIMFLVIFFQGAGACTCTCPLKQKTNALANKKQKTDKTQSVNMWSH